MEYFLTMNLHTEEKLSVTRKISKAVGRISENIQSKLTLGNLDAHRDWGFAGDYVEGMWLMMQHSEPSDWVLATGESHSVRDFTKAAFDFYWVKLGRLCRNKSKI